MNGPESIFYKLLLKKISGALTEEEKLLLADLLKAYPEFSETHMKRCSEALERICGKLAAKARGKIETPAGT